MWKSHTLCRYVCARNGLILSKQERPSLLWERVPLMKEDGRADIETPSTEISVRRVVPAGISARRPEISLRASAQREVESAIMLTLYPMSLKYSDNVIPGGTKSN